MSVVSPSAGVTSPPALLRQSATSICDDTNKTLASCCIGSKEFSYSPPARAPTRTLSGTTNDLSSRFRFLRVRLPTSGIFSHSASVTALRPRFRSANCCCSFGRAARSFASSASSRASLHYQSAMHRIYNGEMARTSARDGVRPCSGRPGRRSCPPLHRPPRMSYPQTDHTHYPGLGIAPGRPLPPRASPVLLYSSTVNIKQRRCSRTG